MDEPEVIDNNLFRDNQETSLSIDRQYLVQPLIKNFDSHVVNRSFCLESQEEDEDEQKVYKMEIEQLKRENNFLKKKIQELNKSLEGQLSAPKKNSKKKPVKAKKAETKQNLISELQFSIDFFFEQIRKTIQSCCQVFRIKLQNQSLFDEKIDTTSSIQNFKYQEPALLQKNLSRIALETQDKRYRLLLDIFMEHYKTSKENQSFLKKKVQSLSQEMIDISKKVLKCANDKQMKNSCSFISMQKSNVQYDNETIRSSLDNGCYYAEKILDMSLGKLNMSKQRTLLNIF